MRVLIPLLLSAASGLWAARWQAPPIEIYPKAQYHARATREVLSEEDVENVWVYYVRARQYKVAVFYRKHLRGRLIRETKAGPEILIVADGLELRLVRDGRLVKIVIIPRPRKVKKKKPPKPKKSNGDEKASDGEKAGDGELKSLPTPEPPASEAGP